MPLNWKKQSFSSLDHLHVMFMCLKAKSILTIALSVIFSYNYPLLTQIVYMPPLKPQMSQFAYEFRDFTSHVHVVVQKPQRRFFRELCMKDFFSSSNLYPLTELFILLTY